MADLPKIGPANHEKCTMSVAEWDRRAATRKKDQQCRGVFFSSFRQMHSFRRCDAFTTEGFCDQCSEIRKNARTNGLDLASVKGIAGYSIIAKALFTRSGVTAAMTFWDRESERRAGIEELHANYPFFRAQDVVKMLMVDGLVIAKNGGKGGRIYKRTKMVVQAQDDYLYTSMKHILTILEHETGKKFMKRWEKIVKAATRIHVQMAAAGEQTEMSGEGAIQAHDIILEELTRTAKQSEQMPAPKSLSTPVVRMLQWATSRERTARRSASATLSDSESPATRSSPESRNPAATDASEMTTVAAPSTEEHPTGEQVQTRHPKAVGQSYGSQINLSRN